MTTETFSFVGPKVPSIPKDPDALLDYSFDWTLWLAGVQGGPDTIASAVVTGSGCTIDSQTDAFPLVHARVSGGTAGLTASVRCRIVTAQGRREDRTIYLLIRER